MHARQKIYLNFEPHFLYDYIFFSTNLRIHQAEENSYRQYSLSDVEKRLCLVNMFELYQKSLEDLAAISLALYRRYNSETLCKFQREFTVDKTPLIYTLINYRPGDAHLVRLLTKFSTDQEILEGLGITNIEYINIESLFPSIDLKKVYGFFLEGLKSLGGDQEKRLKMFNKIKHGGIVLGDGSHPFSNDLMKGTPATMYADPKKFDEDDHPLVVHGLKYNEEEFELMKAGVLKIAVIIKILLSVYLCKEYKDFLKNKYPKNHLEILSEIDIKRLLSLWNGY